MKKAIKKQLRKYPFIRAFFPASFLFSQLQNQVLTTLKHKTSIFFVQVGSNDGMQGDPLYDLITRNKKWRGIFIEPVGFLLKRLKHNYGNSGRYIYENKAIASKRGMIEFHYVSQEAKSELGDILPFWYDQLGSFDKTHILKQLDGILEPYIITEKVEGVPIQDIFDQHKVTELDLLHIDSEGYDYHVLSQIDFSRYKPSVVLYEHMHLSDNEKAKAISLLRQSNYECFEYGCDTLAVSKG